MNWVLLRTFFKSWAKSLYVWRICLSGLFLDLWIVLFDPSCSKSFSAVTLSKEVIKRQKTYIKVSQNEACCTYYSHVCLLIWVFLKGEMGGPLILYSSFEYLVLPCNHSHYFLFHSFQVRPFLVIFTRNTGVMRRRWMFGTCKVMMHWHWMSTPLKYLLDCL